MMDSCSSSSEQCQTTIAMDSAAKTRKAVKRKKSSTSSCKKEKKVRLWNRFHV